MKIYVVIDQWIIWHAVDGGFDEQRVELGTDPSESNYSSQWVTKYEKAHLSSCDCAVFSLMN